MAINFKDSEIGANLYHHYGPLLGGKDLHQCLGYKSASSFKRAVRLGILEVKVFEIPSRRGRFALTQDVARWLGDISEAKKEV